VLLGLAMLCIDHAVPFQLSARGMSRIGTLYDPPMAPTAMQVVADPHETP